MNDNEPLKSCPDCHGELESGAIMDNTYGGVVVQMYGRNSNLVKRSPPWVISAQFEDVREVKTFRCRSCNRLFSYARDEIVVKDVLALQKQRMWAILLAVGILSTIYVLIMYY